MAESHVVFVRTNTAVEVPPLIPEIRLYLANEVVPLWQATEVDLDALGVPPPYWAFAWAGGQALARYVLDSPEIVAGRTVLDFASGSGLAAIAAAMAGAETVTATDIGPYASAAIGLNAALNGVSVEVATGDMIGSRGPWDVVLAGDICYERPAAERITAWLRGLVTQDCLVLLGDPGRTYLPRQGLERLIAYGVKTSRELEDSDLRNAVVWRVGAGVS